MKSKKKQLNGALYDVNIIAMAVISVLVQTSAVLFYTTSIKLEKGKE